jgi:hypothetical protein
MKEIWKAVKEFPTSTEENMETCSYKNLKGAN